MEYITKNIAENLKRLRKSRGFSLDEAAEQTGISKSMLGQIEREESNPTIVTLSKIVSGLRIPFSALISAPKTNVLTIHRRNLEPTKNENGSRVYTYFPYEDGRTFEVYTLEIEPGCEYSVGSHGHDTFEYITVSRGVLTLEANGETHTIEAGGAARFPSDSAHRYANGGAELLVIQCVFTWE